MNLKVSVGLWYMGSVADRFVKEGYRDQVGIIERIKKISEIEGVAGIELHYPTEINEENIGEIREVLDKTGLKIVQYCPHLWVNPQWKYGAFTNPDPKIRKESIEFAKKAIDMGKEFSPEVMVYWPAQDGYDYFFQTDYSKSIGYMVEALAQICDYAKEQKFAIEYKAFEPRTHIFLGRVGEVLTIINEIGKPNLGVNIDIGHALIVKENISESLALIQRYDKLFHTHWNDNHTVFDDDIIVGSVNFWQTLEFTYWLYKSGYNGWHGLDLFPYREDPSQIVRQSIDNIKFFYKMAKIIDSYDIEDIFHSSDPVKMNQILREILKKGIDNY
ncbi:MAG: sugar phosphate isomerase/epimerase family protein [Actinomycetota bacterium]